MTSKSKVKKWLLGCSVSLALLLVIGYFAKTSILKQPVTWSFQIKAYEKADKEHPPKPGGIVFIGSSSIRYWKTLKADMAPLSVLNRGFGGAMLSHVNHYAERILYPYKPKTIVLYAGENDLAWGETGDTVLNELKKFVQISKKKLPGVFIYYVSIKPSISRWGIWQKMAKINTRLKAFVEKQEKMAYIDISKGMLDEKGQPKKDIFVLDNLHMNAKGYQIWTSIIKTRLLQDLKGKSLPKSLKATKVRQSSVQPRDAGVKSRTQPRGPKKKQVPAKR